MTYQDAVKRIATLYRQEGLDELKKAVEVVATVMSVSYEGMLDDVLYELAEVK